jgi:hypothetical protein
MILHICEDNQFVSIAMNQFNKINSNTNIFLVNANPVSLKYVTESKNCIVAPFYSPKHKNIINSHKWKAVIFHNCNQKYKWELILRLSKQTKIIWLSWGSDIYMLPRLQKQLYKKLTKDAIKQTNKYFINFDKEHIIRFILGKYKKQLKAYKHITYCAPVIEEDVQLLNKEYNTNITTIPFSYGDIDYFTGNKNEQIIYGNNILIGNSADFSNNHLDTFHIISKLLLNNSKIIVPLSYGGNKEYISIVTKNGEKLFKQNFQPLLKFIPLNEYRNLLYSCNIAIMNHKRQQALGNIIMLLWMGIRLYLDKRNPIYNFLKTNNLIIFEVSELTERPLPNSLTSAEVLHNRAQLIQLYSKEKVLDKTRNIVNLIYKS